MYVIILAGPPGSGKTTYAEKYLPSHFLRLSKDELIFREATRVGKSYDEIHNDYSPVAYELLRQQIAHCNNRKLDFILDMTNVDEKSRKDKLKLIATDATKIAVYFPAFTPQVLEKRITDRASAGGHPVPQDAVEMFHKRYKIPCKTEGFDLVVSASHFIDIMKVMEFR